MFDNILRWYIMNTQSKQTHKLNKAKHYDRLNQQAK